MDLTPNETLQFNDDGSTNLPVIYPLLGRDGARVWLLLYVWLVEYAGITTRVPIHAATNFASIPWWLRWLISQTDPVIAVPAILHDFATKEWSVSGFSDPYEPRQPIFELSWERKAYMFVHFTELYGTRTARIKGRAVYYGLRIGKWFYDLFH